MSEKEDKFYKTFVQVWYGKQIHDYFKQLAIAKKSPDHEKSIESVQERINNLFGLGIVHLTHEQLKDIIKYLKAHPVTRKSVENQEHFVSTCEFNGLTKEVATSNIVNFMRVLIVKLSQKRGVKFDQTIFKIPNTNVKTQITNAMDTYEALMDGKPVPVPATAAAADDDPDAAAAATAAAAAAAAATTAKKGHDPSNDSESLSSAKSEEDVQDKNFSLINRTKKRAPKPPPITSLRLHNTFTTLTTENKDDQYEDYRDPKIKRSHFLHGRNMDPLPYRHQVLHYSRNATNLGRNKVNVRQNVNLNELKRVLF